MPRCSPATVTQGGPKCGREVLFECRLLVGGPAHRCTCVVDARAFARVLGVGAVVTDSTGAVLLEVK